MTAVSRSKRPPRKVGRWALQDAKARFSELIRCARDGPQHVTVHGRDEVVVISTDEYRRLTGQPTGQALIEALQACPDPEINFEHRPVRTPGRDIEL